MHMKSTRARTGKHKRGTPACLGLLLGTPKHASTAVEINV